MQRHQRGGIQISKKRCFRKGKSQSCLSIVNAISAYKGMAIFRLECVTKTKFASDRLENHILLF